MERHEQEVSEIYEDVLKDHSDNLPLIRSIRWLKKTLGLAPTVRRLHDAKQRYICEIGACGEPSTRVVICQESKQYVCRNKTHLKRGKVLVVYEAESRLRNRTK